jgi:uncharacterized membrane protein YdcZ (DUF606 family)
MKTAFIILGVVVVLLGIAAGAFSSSQSHLFGLYTTTSSPYKDLMVPLIIGGVILIVIGAVVSKKGQNG